MSEAAYEAAAKRRLEEAHGYRTWDAISPEDRAHQISVMKAVVGAFLAEIDAYTIDWGVAKKALFPESAIVSSGVLVPLKGDK